MGDDAPRRATLQAAKLELVELKEGYPTEGTDKERATYFAAALCRGIEIHGVCGLERTVLMENIGHTIGVSSGLLETWLESDSRVGSEFHLGALATQAALMDDHIHACTLVLEQLRLHLEAKDWRAELGAFSHLRKTGLDALRLYGGKGAAEFIEKIGDAEEDGAEKIPFETRRLILSVIADALKAIIGEPAAQPGDADDAETRPDNPSVWVN